MNRLSKSELNFLYPLFHECFTIWVQHGYNGNQSDLSPFFILATVQKIKARAIRKPGKKLDFLDDASQRAKPDWKIKYVTYSRFAVGLSVHPSPVA